VSNDGTSWRRGSRPAGVPVPWSWSTLQRIADSCGYAVPLLQYAGERDLLDQWTAHKDDTAIAAYRAQRNRTSIDDLPALPMAPGDRHSGPG
jgi:hypothetical protein